MNFESTLVVVMAVDVLMVFVVIAIHVVRVLSLSHRANASPKAAFAGSMQLLAGVKLCTARPITNHPHYEDKALRHRTKEVSPRNFTLPVVNTVPSSTLTLLVG